MFIAADVLAHEILIKRVWQDREPSWPVILCAKCLQLMKALFVRRPNIRLVPFELRRHIFARERVNLRTATAQLRTPLFCSLLSLAPLLSLPISLGPLFGSPIVPRQNSTGCHRHFLSTAAPRHAAPWSKQRTSEAVPARY